MHIFCHVCTIPTHKDIRPVVQDKVREGGSVLGNEVLHIHLLQKVATVVIEWILLFQLSYRATGAGRAFQILH